MLLIASSRSQLRAPFFAATSGLCADRRVAARRFLSLLFIFRLPFAHISPSLLLAFLLLSLSFRMLFRCFAHVHLAKSEVRVY